MVPLKKSSSEKVSRCQVEGCPGNPKFSIHKLPQGTKKERRDVRQKWIEALRLESCKKTFYVCGDHFSPEDFRENTGKECIRLKSNAVPSRNLHDRKAHSKDRTVVAKMNDLSLEDEVQNQKENSKYTDDTVGANVKDGSLEHPENEIQSLNENFKRTDDHTVDEKKMYVLEIKMDETSYNEIKIDALPSEDIPILNYEREDPCENDLGSALESYLCELDEKNNETSKVDESIQTNLGYDDSLKEVTLIDMIKTDYELRILTEIPSFLTLDNIAFCVDNLSSAAEQMKKFKASTKTIIIIVMYKLKTAMYFTQLAVFFRISAETLAKYFFEFVPILRAVLKCTVFWPSKEEISANMPSCFKPEYSDCVAVMDCTESPIEKLKSLTSRIRTYSHYKGTYTGKLNIASTPSGFIMHVSSVWGGKASDKHIVLTERVLDNLAENEAVMVDKGYNIYEECKAKGIKLYRPPILDAPQFTAADALKTTSIAKARIHVERVIQRIKAFQIFHRKFTKSTLKVVDDIVFIVCAMVNLSPPVLSEERF